jgi:hypothetical protein
MTAIRKTRLRVVFLAVFGIVPSLSAEIVEIRHYHGKQVQCVHSGLRGVARQCGTEGYARVFTGYVKSAVEIGDTDKLLQLVPDEAFVGGSSDATVVTNQACLNTDIQAGDKWLFYLNLDPNSDKLILSYDSPSKPLATAEDGYFEAKNVQPGRYVVGLGIQPGTGYFSDVPTPVYYPGVGTKEQAIIIELRPHEKRINVDFQLPVEDVLKPIGRAATHH